MDEGVYQIDGRGEPGREQGDEEHHGHFTVVESRSVGLACRGTIRGARLKSRAVFLMSGSRAKVMLRLFLALHI